MFLKCHKKGKDSIYSYLIIIIIIIIISNNNNNNNNNNMIHVIVGARYDKMLVRV